VRSARNLRRVGFNLLRRFGWPYVLRRWALWFKFLIGCILKLRHQLSKGVAARIFPIGFLHAAVERFTLFRRLLHEFLIQRLGPFGRK